MVLKHTELVPGLPHRLKLDPWGNPAERGPGLPFDLKDILSILGSNARQWSWSISEVLWGDQPEWMVVEEGGGLESLEQASEHVPGSKLVEVAKSVHQVVWGQFDAFDEASPEPVVRLVAVDSTWWEVHSANPEHIERVRVAYPDLASPLVTSEQT